MMNRHVIFLLGFIFAFQLAGCKGKVEEPEEVPQVEEVAKKAPPAHFKGSNVISWIEDMVREADAEALKKAEEVAGKYSAEEIVAGVALRMIPDYWNNVPEGNRLKTVSIMNTSFSKLRIEAGLAEDMEVLNSVLYMENEEGLIVASSSPEKGAELFGVR